MGRKLMQASGSSVVVPTEIKVDVASSSAGTTGAMENLNKVVSTLADRCREHVEVVGGKVQHIGDCHVIARKDVNVLVRLREAGGGCA